MCQGQMWSFQKGRIKNTQKQWRHHFPQKSMGAFCCHGNHSLDPICLKTLCSLFPTPMMLHIKFDQDWPTGFRDIQVQKCENFRHSRNSKMSDLILPKIVLNQAFMPVLVTSNFADDSIKTEQDRMETPFSHYKSMGNFVAAQGQLTP